MRDYTEGDRDRILHLLEEDLLALLAIEPDTGAYEVVYTDSSARDLAPPVRGDDFFGVWRTQGLPSVAAEDRDRMAREISRAFLLDQLQIAPVYNTTCRFLIHGEPVYCRIRVRSDAPDPGTIVLGIRNIDAEMRFEQTIQMRLFTQQMHPHFLYNALSSIREIVLTDPDFAADLLYDFTTYLRAGIRAIGSSEKIPFTRELENVRAYLNIEKVRFADRLTVEYDIRVEDFSVIPFCIQPLVENAVRHGIYEKGAEGGRARGRLLEHERRRGHGKEGPARARRTTARALRRAVRSGDK